ncbi:MAG TPA: hypothetical protein VGK67_39530 [Myxococcales bacterium]|jgi:hypothetical protein
MAVRASAIAAVLATCWGASAVAGSAVSGALSLEAGPEYFGGEYYAALVPAFTLESEPVSLELDVPFRLRLNSDLSRERGVYRTEDWDALSDAGRVLRSLDLRLGNRTFVGHLGALAHETLGHGTIVSDYGNALLPDAQPIGLSARLAAGPVVAQVVGGNVLGLDVTAASVGIEPLSLWGEPNDRMHLSVNAAADWDPQAVSTQYAAVFGASLDGTLLRRKEAKLAPYADFNTTARGGHGLHVGILADFLISSVELSLRAEYRHTRGPYQPEYFDLAYSLERTTSLIEPETLGTDTSLAKADVPFRTDDTWRAEARLRVGPVSLAADVRSRGRDPFTRALVHDASGVLEIENGPVSVSAFVAARQFDWGHNPGRILALGEVRYRILPNLHVWTVGGRSYRLEGGGASELWQLGGGIGGALGF